MRCSPILVFLFNCLFFFSFTAPAQTSPDTLFSGTYEQAALQSILSDMEAKTPVRFYYQNQWLVDLKVTATFDKTPVPKVLQKLLEGTTLEAVQYHAYAIVIKPAGFMQPVLATKDSQGRPLNRVEIGSPQKASKAGKVVLRGHLTHAKTGAPLAGATVSVEALKQSTLTHANGIYSLPLPVGEHLVSYKVMGLQPEERIVGLYTTGDLDLTLHESSVQLREVQINSSRLTDQNVETNARGQVTVTFYTSDDMGTFSIEAMGLNKQGLSGKQTYSLQVAAGL